MALENEPIYLEERLFNALRGVLTAASLRRAGASFVAGCARGARAVMASPWFAGGLLAYAIALLVLRPASPFEWDEILFQRALDQYSIATQSPHPPGYPVYVGAAALLRLVVRDPLLALQLTGIAAAAAALILIRLGAARFGGLASAGLAGAAVLAAIPGFAFNANVGLSDVTSAAAALAAVLVLWRGWDDPRLLLWGALVAALAVGVRPQVLPALLPIGLAALGRA
ncbi:MAG: hypothetical protein V1750_10585, partial [Acidobacteriota bacterium]